MQDNIINIDNQPDIFSEMMKDKLENHQLPVDAECWTEIEARMNADKRKKIIPFWWWLSGGAAVAMIALLFTLGTDMNQVELTKNTKPKNTIRKETTNLKSTTPTITTTLATNISSKTTLRTTNKSANSKSNTISWAASHAVNDISESTAQNPLAKTDKNQIAKVESTDTEINKDSANPTLPKKVLPEKLVAKSETEKGSIEPIEEKKDNGGWLLAASFGPNGATSLSASPNYLTMANGEKNLTDILATNYIMPPGSFTTKNYDPALSFGLYVRKNLNKTVSLESGLVYSYLRSTFNETGYISSDASLTLHYLGIPLNLIVKLWKSPKWEVYVSVGGMAEKGLRSVYIQKEYMGNQTITTTANSKIDGLQWSVNSGIGVTYKIQPRLGLYFEPKFSYFFNNNQPLSTRTDQPASFGLSAGVRFELK